VTDQWSFIAIHFSAVERLAVLAEGRLEVALAAAEVLGADRE
jgi:hypothetical protein